VREGMIRQDSDSANGLMKSLGSNITPNRCKEVTSKISESSD